jgi:hypothetical protein
MQKASQLVRIVCGLTILTATLAPVAVWATCEKRTTQGQAPPYSPSYFCYGVPACTSTYSKKICRTKMNGTPPLEWAEQVLVGPCGSFSGGSAYFYFDEKEEVAVTSC